ncbi:MAG: hypothetical protein AAF466_07010 [Bacteroidota bacterium]
MKRFLLHIAHFSCYLLAANLLCYWANQKLYFDRYSTFDGRYDTYLVADSHGHSLDTLTNAFGIFNFSDPSDSYKDMLRKVKYALRNSEVKRILIAADHHTLTTYRETNNNLDRSAIYASREDYPSWYASFNERYLQRYVPLIHGKSRDALLMHIKSLWSNTSRNKSHWADASREYRMSRARLRAGIHYGASKRSKEMEALLTEIIQLCKQQGVEVMGLKFPLSPEYREATNGLGYAPDRIFEKAGVELLDFRAILNRPEDFRDQDHVSETGGRKLLPVIDQYLNQP